MGKYRRCTISAWYSIAQHIQLNIFKKTFFFVSFCIVLWYFTLNEHIMNLSVYVSSNNIVVSITIRVYKTGACQQHYWRRVLKGVGEQTKTILTSKWKEKKEIKSKAPFLIVDTPFALFHLRLIIYPQLSFFWVKIPHYKWPITDMKTDRH